MNFDLEKNIFDYPIVAFDTETSGAYTFESEVIELGAVKWYQGKVIDRFQVLLKPDKLLMPENIRIHGITNEMLVDASKMSLELPKFCDFIQDSILIAHHAPFDLGFLALAIEDIGLLFPNNFIFCSSLLSRALIATTNHKLQTLIKELKLVGGDAHRAYDDANACLQVFLKCIEKLDSPVSLNKLKQVQKKEMTWNKYSIWSSQDQKIIRMAKACRNAQVLQIVYDGGQTKSKPRSIKPLGIVRNPDGDYVSAECCIDLQRKRFYLDKILDYEI